MIEPFSAIVFLVLVMAWGVWEVRGVRSKRRGDTQTEAYRWALRRLPAPLAALVRVAVAGFLIWAAFHLQEWIP